MAKIEIKHRININIVLLIQIKERDFYILNSNSSERRGNEERFRGSGERAIKMTYIV